FSRPAYSRPAWAHGGEAWTIRLYAILFDGEQGKSVSGIDGLQYTVKIRQEGSPTAAASVRLYFNYDAGTEKRFLSVEKGKAEKGGNGYIEFKIQNYMALRAWLVSFQNVTYAIAPANAILDPSPDGEFWEESKGEWITPMSAVYDADDNPLYFTTEGYVINGKKDLIFDAAKGYDAVGGDTLVRYENNEFVNEMGGKLTVSGATDSAVPVSRNGESARAAQISMVDGVEAHYLLHDDHKVRSIISTDKVYKITVTEKPKDKNDNPKPYEILCTYTQKEMTWWQHAFSKFVGTARYEDDWSDLRGNHVDPGKYASFEIKENLYRLITQKEKYDASGTIRDFIGEVAEQIKVSGEPYYKGTPAVDMSTGEKLYDDHGNEIQYEKHLRVNGTEFGQLIDVYSWPLVSSLGRPCFFEDGIYYSTDSKGVEYQMTISLNFRLVDSEGFEIHSVVDEILEGVEMYNFWLKDGVTTVPGILKRNEDGSYTPCYLNGDKIPDEVIEKPNIDMDDRYEKHPDEKPKTGLENLLSVLEKVGYIILAVIALIAIGFIVWLLIKVLGLFFGRSQKA
ncbi:MAG: hypothetical protein LBL66_02115, partial [Clostridiales bacterium]|nr:hypothetical protein [Clostridiales bacterium]